MKTIYLMISMFCAGTALGAPDTSPRPVAREQAVAQAQTPPLQRPQVRPDSMQMVAMQQVTFASVQVPMSVRPLARSPSLEQQVMGKRRKLAKGAICGERAIQGEKVGYVPGRIKGCGIKDAVKVRSVSGISLSQAAVIDCPTAQALRKWVDAGLTPAMKTHGKVTQIRVAAHYACRTRNNRKGARISEHGKGRAIDISGFTLQDGTEITVLNGWNAKSTSQALRKMHKSACGPFGTVLGPKSDGYHRDHFHFDTARYRSGTYCR